MMSHYLLAVFKILDEFLTFRIRVLCI